MNDAQNKKSSEKTASGSRLAKVIARAGLCSRRQAEQWISAGRVGVNGNIIRTPAFNVSETDKIEVDNKPINEREGTRVWLYHKPVGLVVTEKDPEGRQTVFNALKNHGLPRVLSIGRLDINTEGLLLLTNDGGLKRVLELPATGWLRRYRVRAHGSVTQNRLDKLKNGIEIEGIKYGSIDAKLESSKGANVWINVALREGKNREIKNVLLSLGLQVNRLIRTSYGPFQLSDLPIGSVSVVKSKILREQLGKRLAVEAGVDFESPLPDDAVFDEAQAKLNPNKRFGKKRAEQVAKKEEIAKAKGNMPELEDQAEGAQKLRKPAPHRKGNFEYKPRPEYVKEPEEKRIVYFGGKRGKEEFVPKAKREKPEDEGGKFEPKGARGRLERGSASGRGDRDNRSGDKKFSGKSRGTGFDKGKSFSKEGRPDRGARPDRGDRPSRDGEKTSSSKSYGAKPFGAKPFGAKPSGEKSFGSSKNYSSKSSRGGSPRGGSSRGGPPRSGPPRGGPPRSGGTRGGR